MLKLFLSILNMSISASWLILAVILIRYLLKKVPKSLTCMLWILVGIRMILPFSFESIFSLIPSKQTIPENIMGPSIPMIQSGFDIVDNMINPIISDGSIIVGHHHVDLMQFIVIISCIVWGIGVLSMFVYCIVSYVKLKRQVGASLQYKENAYFCDDITVPFILGVFDPKIYIPSDIDEEFIESVLAHEKSHLKRKDHIWKMIGYVILTIHWFNPLAWIAYVLLGRDIELACDELVIMNMEENNKREYCHALLSVSDQNRLLLICPLAFGEIGVKERIKMIANYKKPAFWIVLLSCVLCLVACAGFMSDPVSDTTMRIVDINDGATFEDALNDVCFVEVGSENKSITLVYKKDMKSFTKSLQDVMLSKEAVLEDRSRDRFNEHYMILHHNNGTNTKIHLNASLSEMWIEHGINVSYTYKIEDIEALKPMLSMITSYSSTLTGNDFSDLNFKDVEVLKVKDENTLLVRECARDVSEIVKEVEIETKTKENGKNLFRIGEKLKIITSNGWNPYEFNNTYRINGLETIVYLNDMAKIYKDYGSSKYFSKLEIDKAMEHALNNEGYYHYYASSATLYYDEDKMLDLFNNKYGGTYTPENTIIIFTRIVPSRRYNAYLNYDVDVAEDGYSLVSLNQL